MIRELRISVAVIFVLTGSFMAHTTWSCSGCHAKSMNLSQDFDAKEYHHVQCDCACSVKKGHHNKCPECGHVHIPQHMEVVSTKDRVNPQLAEKYAAYLESPTVMLQRVIEKN